MPNASKSTASTRRPYWQVRLFVEGRLKRKSTGCADRREAIAFAKQFYNSIRIAQRLDINVHAEHIPRLRQVSNRASDSDGRGTTRRPHYQRGRKKLNKDILPFFATKAVSAITAADIQDYVDQLSNAAPINTLHLAKHIVVIRKVLKEARRRALLKSLPLFPTISRKDNPRSYFTDIEYKKLRDTAKDLSRLRA